jgi:hypothetical protein
MVLPGSASVNVPRGAAGTGGGDAHVAGPAFVYVGH